MPPRFSLADFAIIATYAFINISLRDADIIIYAIDSFAIFAIAMLFISLLPAA